MSHRPIDLRAEVRTRPTAAMWQAMEAAEIGWASQGEDDNVIALEARMAELTGKEASLYVATTSIANLLALMIGAEKGDQIVLEADMHMVWIEGWNLAYVCNLFPKLVHSSRGEMPLDEVESAITTVRGGRLPSTSMIAIENPHNDHGGTVLSADYLRQLGDLAAQYGCRLHLDAARIHNASVASGLPVSSFTAPATTVAISLNKGLGAPFGAVLCGSASDIRAARQGLMRIGAWGIHRAGFLAAAALWALDHMVDRLAEDHRRARDLADGIRNLPGIEVNYPETNLVWVDTRPSDVHAARYVEGLKARGVLAALREPYAFKFMVHHEITDEVIEQTKAAMERVIGDLPAEPPEVRPPTNEGAAASLA